MQKSGVKVEIKPTQQKARLREYLRPRFKKVSSTEKGLEVETGNPERLSLIPGVESYEVEGEKRDGLGGKPIHRKAFFEIKDREDAAKAFLATVEGVSLVVSTERTWDLRALKKYNSDIVQGDRELADELGIEDLDIEFELSEPELLEIYREFLV